MPKISELPAGSSAAGTDQFAANQSGTTRRLTGTQVQTMVLDSYAGGTSITTLGTVATGTWQGTVIAGAYGGTGAANTGKTITLGGNVTTSGAHALTLTLTGATNVTLPTTGTLVAGGAVTTSGLTQATARLLGRTTASTGAIEEISVSDLTFATGALSQGKGAWVEISRATASSSATIDFTGIGSTYDEYMVAIYSAVPATDGADLMLRTSTDGGSSYDAGASDYVWVMSGGAVSSTSDSSTTNNTGSASASKKTAIYLSNSYGASGIDNTANQGGWSGMFWFAAPSAVQYLNIIAHGTYWNSENFYEVRVSGARATAADVDAIRFLMSSGNITSGTFVLLGRKK